MRSAHDERLIIHLLFAEEVAISSLWIKGPGAKAPKNVKLFINLPEPVSLDSFASSEATQALQFGGTTGGASSSGAMVSNAGEERCLRQLNFVRFQRVQSLQLFIVDNLGGGKQTIIEELKIFGLPQAETNMQDFLMEVNTHFIPV